VALRGLTNVLLRDLNVNLLAEHMARGAPALYCDFVYYDEVAHHAGPTRPESLASLEGIDRVLGVLQETARHTTRPYHFVVLSDHGQSQGATFRQRYGSGVEDVVRSLLAEPRVAQLA
jgi:predicted AlkP superfamily pyrophosphatase or phosphodiesterase